MTKICKKVIAIDFDGTVVRNRFPEMGKVVPYARESLVRLVKDENKLILYSMRENEQLQASVELLKSLGISLWGINNNPAQKYWAPEARKVHADIVISVHNAAAPIVDDVFINAKGKEVNKPYLDWMVLMGQLGYLYTEVVDGFINEEEL